MKYLPTHLQLGILPITDYMIDESWFLSILIDNTSNTG